MRDIPIIFSGPMVRALFEDRKTMTRRLRWRDTKIGGKGNGRTIETPWTKVKPGDRLWVKETWARTSVVPIVSTIDDPWVVYRECDNRTDYGGPWRSPLHCARKDSRITLIVTATKIERLQDISEADAIAEGCPGCLGPNPDFPDEWDPAPQEEFRDLWRRLHGADAWDENPEVVALTFTVHKQNIDTLPIERAA